MNETEIRKYAELMRELDLTGLELTEDNRRIRLERSHQSEEKETVYLTAASGIPAPALPETSVPEPESADYTSIKSPIVGVFYASPAENAEPYVAVGDSVKKGQTLCIVEAMKLMNEIVADNDGIIAEICVTNNQVVEYGTELFHIRKAVV